MRNLFIFTLFLATTCLIFKEAFIYANFLVNRDFISAEKCVNRADLECQGKCFLEKQISELNKDSKESPTPPKEIRNSVQSYINSKISLFSQLSLNSNPLYNLFNENLYNSGHTGRVFHPPC